MKAPYSSPPQQNSLRTARRASSLLSCTRGRQEKIILLALVAIVVFFSLRVSQLRQSSRDASTIRTVLTTTQGGCRADRCRMHSLY